MLYDFTDMKYPEQENLQTESRLVGSQALRGGMRSDYKWVSFVKDANVLKLDSDDNCATL